MNFEQISQLTTNSRKKTPSVCYKFLCTLRKNVENAHNMQKYKIYRNQNRDISRKNLFKLQFFNSAHKNCETTRSLSFPTKDLFSGIKVFNKNTGIRFNTGEKFKDRGSCRETIRTRGLQFNKRDKFTRAAGRTSSTSIPFSQRIQRRESRGSIMLQNSSLTR